MCLIANPSSINQYIILVSFQLQQVENEVHRWFHSVILRDSERFNKPNVGNNLFQKCIKLNFDDDIS